MKRKTITKTTVVAVFVVFLFTSVFFPPQRVYAIPLISDIGAKGCVLFGKLKEKLFSAAEDKLKDKIKEEAKEKAKEAAKEKAKEAAKEAAGKAKNVLDPTTVPVHDVKSESAIKSEGSKTRSAIKSEGSKTRSTEREINCQNFINKVVLQILKKRLLDMIVDETIQWIQNGGDPRFITDPGDFFKEAADAAAGDIIQQTALADLCYPTQLPRLILQLQTPVFSQQISCTLSSVVDNLSDYARDFSKGGFIGLNEIALPQNNRWGQLITLHDAYLKEKTKKDEIKQREASAGRGFLDQKRCKLWIEVLDFGEFGNRPRSFSVPGDLPDDYYLKTPDDKIGGTSVPYTGKEEQPTGSKFKCKEYEIISPGQIVGETVSKAIGSDIDYIVNADDLTAYVTAIFDAVINRLTTEARSGLLGLFNDPNSPPRGSGALNCDQYTGQAKESCLSLQGEIGAYNDYSDNTTTTECDQFELGSQASLTCIENNGKGDITGIANQTLQTELSEALTNTTLAVNNYNTALNLANELDKILGELIACQSQKTLDCPGSFVPPDFLAAQKKQANQEVINQLPSKSQTANDYKPTIQDLQDRLTGDPTLVEDSIFTAEVTEAVLQANSFLRESENFISNITRQKTEAEINLATCQSFSCQ